MKCNQVLLLGGAVVLLASQAEAAAVTARVNAPYAVSEEIEFAANGVGEGELSFTWDFGDGESSEPSSSGTVTHKYKEPGHYPVIVVVKDDTGVRSDSFLQTVHRALPAAPPVSSSSIVYHRSAGRVCNVNADNDTVSCLATDDLSLVFEAPVGRHPRSLAVDADGHIWVTNQDDSTVSVLDADGAELGVIELPRASLPFGLVVSAQRGRAYVALQARGEVAELDLAERKLLRTVPAGPWATGLALDSSADRLFVTRFISSTSGGEVVELDASTLEVARHFEVALDPGPDTEATARGVPNYLRSVVPSPDGALLWVPSKQDNIFRGEARDGLALTFESSVRTVVSTFDLSTNQEVVDLRVDLNNRTLGLALTFSPLGDYAFVALLGNNGVEVIDAYNGKIVTGAFELGHAPDGLVLDDAGLLYVNSFLSRSVVVLDASATLASIEFSLPVVDEVVVSLKEKLSDEVLEGKIIFYDAADQRMGKDGYISCAACHLDGFEDGQVWDFTDRGEGLRNTTSLLGRRGTGQGPLHWSANFDEVQDFEHDMRGPFGGAGFLPDDVFNTGTRNTTLGDTKAGLSPELDAMAAYVTSLNLVHESPHRDEDGSLTKAGWRGRALFQEAGCPACHGGADFTDSPNGVLHDVGTITADSGKRLGMELEGIDTPTLRGIWQTAPYLHDGSAATLLDVVGGRNAEDLHGVTSSLSEDERSDLVSYLLQIDNTALQSEVEPEAPDEEEPGPTGAGGDAGVPAGSGGAQTDQPEDDNSAGDRGGCSVSGRGRGSPGPATPGLFSLLLLAWVGWSRRRSVSGEQMPHENQ